MAGTRPGARDDRPLLGIMMMLVAWLMFSCLDSAAKWMALGGMPVLQIAFMRYFVHLAISAGIVAAGSGGRGRFGTGRAWLVVSRGVLLAGSTLCNFVAVQYLSLTLTATIMFSAPIIICALSGPLLGERVGPWRWGAIVVGFIGILVAIRPFDATFHPAMLLSLLGTLCFVGYALITRKLAGEVSTDTMQFYGALVGTVMVAPGAFAVWQTPVDAASWLLLIAPGLFGWFGHQLMTGAHTHASASLLTPFSYVHIVYMTAWSALLFNQWPDALTLAGAAIITASGLVIWLRELRLAREPVGISTGRL